MSRNNATAAPRVLLTGASGFIGGHLARTLAEQGCRLRILARATSRLSHLDGVDFERCEGDLTDPVSLIQAVEATDYIYHMGGLIKARSEDEFIAVNGEGTKNLCAVARTHAPRLKRFLYLSSMAAAGPAAPGQLIDEDMPAQPITPYGASKRLGEKWLQQFDFLWTIVRPPAVYGPADRGMLDLFRLAARHVRPTLGHDGTVSVVYVNNLVDGMIRAATRPEGVGQIFYIADDPPCGRKELARLIQDAVATWAVPVHFPSGVVHLAARLSESVAAGFGRVALFDTHKARELLAPNWGCRITKAATLLEYQPEFTTRDGLAQTAQWYRQAGWI